MDIKKRTREKERTRENGLVSDSNLRIFAITGINRRDEMQTL